MVRFGLKFSKVLFNVSTEMKKSLFVFFKTSARRDRNSTGHCERYVHTLPLEKKKHTALVAKVDKQPINIMSSNPMPIWKKCWKHENYIVQCVNHIVQNHGQQLIFSHI